MAIGRDMGYPVALHPRVEKANSMDDARSSRNHLLRYSMAFAANHNPRVDL